MLKSFLAPAALAVGAALPVLATAAPVAAQSAESAAPAGVPLSEYGELPAVESATLSQSGTRIALISTIDKERSLAVVEPGKGLLTKVSLADMKVRSITWIGDDRLLLISSQTEELGYGFATDKAEFSVARVIPLSRTGKAGLIFGEQSDLVDSIMGDYGIRQIDGRWYGFFGGIQLARSSSRTGYQLDHTRPHLFRVDLETLAVREMAGAAPAGFEHDWLIDASGNIAATFEMNLETGSWRLRAGQGRALASGTNKLGAIGLIGLGYGGQSVLLSERTEQGVEWYEVPLAGGEMKRFLPDIKVLELYFDDETGHLIGYLEDGPNPRPVFRDPKLASIVAMVRKAFPQDDMDMQSWTADLSRIILRTSGPQDSGTWYTVDMASLRAEPIAYERLRIDPDQVGPMQVFAYKAADGMEMDGILTLPPGREPKGLPAVVLPHGGPHAHDVNGFDWWAQAYASRGYAVFQPNFRGSTNRDQAFMRAGFGEWGGKMQTDKSDGLKALVDKGIVDPARVCIVGASYGGYAALAGVTLQQGIYRCAVAVAPVSDIADMFREDVRASGQLETTRAALLNQLGPRERWNAASPLRAADRASAPIMLIHGADDTVVPYAHSVRMAKALKDAGKRHEFITLKGEDHWLSRSETRRTMLEAAVRFVEEHNPAR